jgi:hypothetical protein
LKKWRGIKEEIYDRCIMGECEGMNDWLEMERIKLRRKSVNEGWSSEAWQSR